MQPYDFISEITEDILANHFSDNYCFIFFDDHIRFRQDLAEANLNNYSGEDKKLAAHATLNTRLFNNVEVNDYNGHIPIVSNNSSPTYHNNHWISSTKYSLSEFKRTFNNNIYEHSWEPIDLVYDQMLWESIVYQNKKYNIQGYILHSEHNSTHIKELEKLGLKSVHWFAHAYLCSEFYFRHYSKLKMLTDYKSRPINHAWICANRLLRQHRTDFLEKLDLSKGCYSLLNPDPNGLTYHGPVPVHSFDDHTNSSAEICVTKLTPWNTSFLHVVSETVWQDKIHFTEKVFKPIVLHQPFVVLQAPGSLAYLRSYGFKTFGAWWDESYDAIEDPTERMQAIADIVNSIGNKSLEELETMRMEMASVLEHNFRHFYENIPAICLDELRKGIATL